ncbi:MAG TPA: YbhB/YbcL family Raf kinase inhibitor-like protein [Vicinamibacterales bacterium]|nr:YbhB/YbcL family Raf kinase inhibitor-like protein [Vicinamibacterales bacterium]
MKITSSAFTDKGEIPRKFTCDGDDISPPIEWSDVPADAKTVALICDDPDAPKQDFTHWVVFDRPPTARPLPEHLPAEPELPNGGRQGKNDFGKVGYGGPCPPSGTHRYRFTLYALDTELGVPPSSSRKDVETAMKGHVLQTAQLTAVYTRAT